MASGMSTTIYTLSVTDSYFMNTWGTTNTLSSSTYVYWNTPIYNNITPNYSNPIVFSNTYTNTGSSFTVNIYVMCDNMCAFYLNGTLIGNNGTWPNGSLYNITIQTGVNTFNFFCENDGYTLNAAGFAVNMYNNNNNLIMLTDNTCSGGTNCSGWTCNIGGFFTKNQPLLTFYQIGGPQSNSGYASNVGDIQNGFKSGTTTANSNYNVSSSDLSTLNAPCIPIINYLSSTDTSITIYWYYFGLCNSYKIYYGTSSPPTTIHTISSGNFWEYSNTHTNSSTNQKYCNYSSSVTGVIFQTGYNSYTLTGLSSGTSYNLYVSCGFYTIDSTSSLPNKLSSSTGSSNSAIKSYSTQLTPFTSTSGILTTVNGTLSLASNFYMPNGYNYFNFYVFGAGGNSIQNTGNAAGAGSGGFIQATTIPYSYSGYTISSINYVVAGVGNGGYSSISIIYTSSIYINITANSANSVTANNPTQATSGGTTNYTNTTPFYNNSNIKQASGATGGNSNPSSGSTSGYTCSGSGGTLSGPAYNYFTATFSTTAKDGNSYSNISCGGGSNQIVSGYGSGGAATPAGYNNNNPAIYRYGTQGCIYYTLS